MEENTNIENLETKETVNIENTEPEGNTETENVKIEEVPAVRKEPPRDSLLVALIKNYGFIIPMMLVILFLFHTVILVGQVPSRSMYPTLDVGAGLFALKTDVKDVYRGEIVIFHPMKAESDPNEVWIKRIIGLPGDEVELKEDSVYVNGEKLDEPYVNGEPEYLPEIYNVPEGKIFLMGDNRDESNDSRFWESPYLPLENLIAKPILTYPLSPNCSSGFKQLNQK